MEVVDNTLPTSNRDICGGSDDNYAANKDDIGCDNFTTNKKGRKEEGKKQNFW